MEVVGQGKVRMKRDEEAVASEMELKAIRNCSLMSNEMQK